MELSIKSILSGTRLNRCVERAKTQKAKDLQIPGFVQYTIKLVLHLTGLLSFLIGEAFAGT